jgi:hypothetical protein
VPDGDFCAQGICPKCECCLAIVDRASRTARIAGLLRDLLRIVAGNGGFTPTGALWKTRFGRIGALSGHYEDGLSGLIIPWSCIRITPGLVPC